jgi:hypothetical protein
MAHSVTHIAALDNRLCVVRHSQPGTIEQLVNTSFTWICSSFNGYREQPEPDTVMLTSPKGLLMTAGVGASFKSSRIAAMMTHRQDRHCRDKW